MATHVGRRELEACRVPSPMGGRIQVKVDGRELVRLTFEEARELARLLAEELR